MIIMILMTLTEGSRKKSYFLNGRAIRGGEGGELKGQCRYFDQGVQR